MLACDARAHNVSVKSMQLLDVSQQDVTNLRSRRRLEHLTGGEVMVDFPKYPGFSLGCATDQQSVGARLLQNLLCLEGRINIAIGKDRNPHRLFNGGNGVVLRRALVSAG